MQFRKNRLLCFVWILAGMVSYASFAQEKQEQKTYYKSGEPESAVPMTNGKKNGEGKTWYPSGKIKEKGNWVNGQRNGLWIFYAENGNVSKKVLFKNDVPHGKTSIYYPNKKIDEEDFYSSGQVDSLKRYFRTGKLKEHTTWAEGRKLRRTVLFDSLGTGRAEYVYRDGRLIKQ